MRIHPEHLQEALGRGIAPVYLLSGDEPLQIIESADAIRRAASEHGHAQREVLQVEAGFDWASWSAASQAFSLFGERRLLDLRFTAKPDRVGAEALAGYATRPPEDAVLVASMPKLSSSDQKAQWFQALDSVGVIVQVWPLEGEKLLRWLDRRLNARGVLADQSGLRIIAARVEGNLLAAAQEVEKLQILYGKGRLDDTQIAAAVADSARFDVFDLADQAMRGDLARTYRVLMGLRAEGVAAPVVLWALSRDLRLLAQLGAELAGGNSLDGAFRKHKVWDKRKSILEKALGRLGAEAIQSALLRAVEVDRTIKGLTHGDPWDGLLGLCAVLTGHRSVSR